MTVPVHDFTTEYNVRCELPGCGKLTKHPFRIFKDGVPVTTCSPYHANEADKRWEEKKKMNIRIGVPPKEENETFEGDNISEF